MTIQGQSFLDGHGQVFVPKGTVVGHGELARTGDEQASADLGANFRRIGIRWWGDYGSGFQVDSEEDLNPGNIDLAYWDRTAAQFAASRAAGLSTLLFMDSNCGQGLGGTACKLDNVTDSDFFMPSGAEKRAKFIAAAVFAAQNLRGLIDMMEPLVEPAGTSDQASLWAFQEELMTAVLAVDPAMLFLIGPTPNYQPNSIDKAFKPAWGQVGSPFYRKTALTANFLTNLATNPTNRVNRLGFVTAARAKYNCPVLIQQVGTTLADDPDDAHLDTMLGLLDNASGGPIGYSVWEEMSVFPNSYGYLSLSNSADPNSARNTNAHRRDVLQSHFTA